MNLKGIGVKFLKRILPKVNRVRARKERKREWKVNRGESQEGEEKGKEEMEKTAEEEGKKPEEKCFELEDTCMVVECALDEVEDALRVSIKHLQCIKEIVKKGREGKKEFFNEMCAFYVMLVGMKEKKLMPGELLERKL